MSAEDSLCLSPSPVVSLVTDSVPDIVSALKASVKESEKCENGVQLQFAHQIRKTNVISVQLDDEKKRNARLLYALSRKDSVSEISSSEQSSNRGQRRDQHNAFNDPRKTFGTISPVLMLYRFGSST